MRSPCRRCHSEISAGSTDEVEVAVTDRSDVRDVELPHVPSELLLADPDELRDLGLVLLSRMASHVSHTTISGWHYVSIVIERRRATVHEAPPV